MVFTPDQLLVFRAVAEYGTVTAAARELHVSQPAVSARLRSLETLVGAPLFHRAPHGMELTAAGAALLPHARAIARAMSRASAALAAAAPVVVAAVSEAAIPLVVPALAWVALGPAATALRVVPCDAASALGAVVAGEADLAVAVASPGRPQDMLDRRPLLVDEIVLVHGGDLPERAPVQIVEGLTVLWQAAGSGVRATVERAFEAAGSWPAASIDLGTSLGVLSAVAAGAGVGVLTRGYVAEWVRAGRVDVTAFEDGDFDARFEIITPPESDLAAGVRRVAEALRRPDHARAVRAAAG